MTAPEGVAGIQAARELDDAIDEIEQLLCRVGLSWDWDAWQIVKCAALGEAAHSSVTGIATLPSRFRPAPRPATFRLVTPT